jgi:ADP-ribose pyrophosphatase YjhB (NUDIX family)
VAFFIGCGIVLKRREKYILIQEVRHEKAGFYNLPAGTPEMNEDFIHCITRETKEETGAEMTLEHFVGVYQTVISSGSNVVFLVFAGSVSKAASFHSEEHKVIEAYTYEEIVALDEAGELRSPIVRKSIEDYRNGQKLPLDIVQSWHVDTDAFPIFAGP